MFQARHKQLIQETNVAVVNIRTIELNYFTHFFSNLGVNAAVGFGLIAGSVSQVPGFDNPTKCWYGFVLLYWFASALTVVSSIFALVTEIFVVVYGNGLALRGPSGSMVKANDGMVEEQQTIFWAFIITIFFLGLQQIGMYFIMMDSTSAWVTGALTVIAMISWYRYGLRIYNRFNWNQIDLAWKEEEEKNVSNDKKIHVDEDDEIDPITRLQQQLQQYQQQQQQQQHQPQQQQQQQQQQSTSPASGKGNTSDKRSSIFSFGRKSKKLVEANNEDDKEDTAYAYEKEFFTATTEKGSDKPYFASKFGKDKESASSTGFLSIRVPRKRSIFASLTTSRSDESGDDGQWRRRFFLVQDTHVYYYTDRRAYELEPTKPLNPRPILLDGYTLIGGAQVAPYYISLLPADPEDDRRAWKFRCDTLSEFEQWIDIFARALRDCASWRDSETTEFIDIAAMRADPTKMHAVHADDSDEDD